MCNLTTSNVALPAYKWKGKTNMRMAMYLTNSRRISDYKTRGCWKAPSVPRKSWWKYKSADKSLARPGRKQANVSDRMAWISFCALPCRKKKTLMIVRVSMLLKSRASLTCFRACFLPGRAKDFLAPRYLPWILQKADVIFTFWISLNHTYAKDCRNLENNRSQRPLSSPCLFLSILLLLPRELKVWLLQ